MSPPLLQVRDLEKTFDAKQGYFGATAKLKAVAGVSFDLEAGQTLGIVGESGCGKSTVARLVTRLTRPSGGRILFKGLDITRLPEARLRPQRRHIQIIFQDPYSSLDPRQKVGDIVAEPLRNFGIDGRTARRQVAEVLERTGLPADAAERYPHAFSGGQRQRIGIARALVLKPQLLVCDEAVSALDVSVQAQILNLLSDIQRDLGIAMIFISHNLGVIRHVSHRVAVMYLGRFVEVADERALFATPRHPYTRALIATVPEPNPRRRDRPPALSGELPSPLAPPPGCAFSSRCPMVQDICRSTRPPLERDARGHEVACHFATTEALP